MRILIILFAILIQSNPLVKQIKFKKHKNTLSFILNIIIF